MQTIEDIKKGYILGFYSFDTFANKALDYITEKHCKKVGFCSVSVLKKELKKDFNLIFIPESHYKNKGFAILSENGNSSFFLC